ncbi:MAG: DinB family protein [Chloroflexi bacterium]|nr:DinB family protein [Chloroflexota bacterium]
MHAVDLFGHWGEVRSGLLRALDKLDDDQLRFVPREGLWSLGKVAGHIADAEEGWFRFVVTRDLDGWPTSPPDDYPTVESVKALLTAVHDRTLSYLATVDVAELDRLIATPRGRQIPLRWIVWHVLEHEIHHRGEIFLMLGLMGIEGPRI